MSNLFTNQVLAQLISGQLETYKPESIVFPSWTKKSPACTWKNRREVTKLTNKQNISTCRRRVYKAEHYRY
jgi:hypothetical protein